MDLMVVLTLAYCVIALIAIILTIQERMREKIQGLRLAALGFLACLFWPLTTAYMLVAVTIDARTRPPR